ncbi:alpha-L-fucosidase [Jiangella endophytica]|uniref:alpha-L-fucosidase n=1 Tax=Jiangella endophytica TaxID=1623398 RepID=UPI000E354D0E|nr:alpha-L-fucosidase [Jiangella endophytica]
MSDDGGTTRDHAGTGEAAPGPWPPRVVPRREGDDADLARVTAVVRDGPFSDAWESLTSGYSAPPWYQDAKFGIFVHWGVYSVPAFRNEWYARTMYLEGSPEYDHHVATHGPQAEFGYKDFIPRFHGERFDAQEWVRAFRRAGAQFVVPVAEHHDGFAMYDTARSRWKAPLMGPRRDVIGELATATRDAGMVFGVSSHRAEHWWFMNGGSRFDSDVRDPEFADFYGPAMREETAPNEQFLEDWLLRTVEVIDRYRPQVLWFDWWVEQPAFEPYLRRLAAYYYNQADRWGRGVVINHKWSAFRAGAAVYDIERGSMAEIRPDVWQNDTAVSKVAWCWVDGHRYKSVADLVAELADVVAKNGVLLLNVGPKPDGTIAEEEQLLLDGLGDWLNINGEAIYGTRPWVIPGEGPTQNAAGSFVDDGRKAYTAADVRFTTRTDVTGLYLYAILLGRSADGVARIRSLGRASGLLPHGFDRVELLGHRDADGLSWERDDDYLAIRLPPESSHLGAVVKVPLSSPSPQPRVDFLHG